MTEFIKTYWKLIVALILVVLDIVLIVIKKRPFKVVDAVTATISDILPKLILDAEAEYPQGHGDLKLELVVQLCKNFLISSLGLTASEVERYEAYIKLRVEAILSTPKKKGD